MYSILDKNGFFVDSGFSCLEDAVDSLLLRGLNLDDYQIVLDLAGFEGDYYNENK